MYCFLLELLFSQIAVAQASMSNSLAGALSLATSPSSQHSQGSQVQPSLTNYRISNLDMHSDKHHNFVGSNVQLPLAMDPLLGKALL